MPHRDQIILLRSGSIIRGSDVALGPKTVLILIAAGMMSSRVAESFVESNLGLAFVEVKAMHNLCQLENILQWGDGD
jgi:hypothetical protein